MESVICPSRTITSPTPLAHWASSRVEEVQSVWRVTRSPTWKLWNTDSRPPASAAVNMYSFSPMTTEVSVRSSSVTSNSRRPETERVSSGSVSSMRTIQPGVLVWVETVEKS